MEVPDYTSQPQPRRQKTKSYTDQEWDNIKPHFCELYVTKGWTLKQTKRAMAERHQFFASDKMYKTRIKRWNLRKYNQDRESLHVIRKANEAAENGNSVVFRVNGRLVTPDEAKKHFVRKGIDYEQALAHRRLCSPTPSAIEVADQSQNETPQSDELDVPRNLDLVANHTFLDLVSLDSIQKPVNSPKSPVAGLDTIVDWPTLDSSSWLDPYLACIGAYEGPYGTPPEILCRSPCEMVSTVPRLSKSLDSITFAVDSTHRPRHPPCASVGFSQFAEPSDQDKGAIPQPRIRLDDERYWFHDDDAINDLSRSMEGKLHIVDAETRRRY